jgi:hypothetical protein
MSFGDVVAELTRVSASGHHLAATAPQQKRGILRRCKALSQDGIELIELCLHRVVVRKSGSPFHLTDDWIQGAIGVLG